MCVVVVGTGPLPAFIINKFINVLFISTNQCSILCVCVSHLCPSLPPISLLTCIFLTFCIWLTRSTYTMDR